MSKKKIKEKHIIPKGMKLNQNDFIFDLVKDEALRCFVKISSKHKVSLSKLNTKFKETFVVSDYINKDYDEFFSVLWDNVIKPVLIDEGVWVDD